MITVKHIELKTEKTIQEAETDFYLRHPLGCKFLHGKIYVFFEEDTIARGEDAQKEKKDFRTFLILKHGETYEQVEDLFWNYIDTVVTDEKEFIHIFMGLENIPF